MKKKIPPRFPQLHWTKLTDDQRDEIRKEFKDWDESKLAKGFWSLHAIKLSGGREHISWSVSFGQTFLTPPL